MQSEASIIKNSLAQLAIDMRKTHEDTYEKLYHIQSLRLEEISGNKVKNPTEGCLFSTVTLKEEKPRILETAAAPLLEDNDSHDAAVLELSRAIAKIYAGRVDPANLSMYSHIAITRSLWHFLYAKPGNEPVLVPIGYSDGSQGKPFPLLSLSKIQERDLNILRKMPETPIGEITDRHPEMDVVVERYWFRNQLVSVSRPMAETDEIAYLYSKDLLSELKKNGKIRIAFYQTGFPPAAIGFYRALAEELIQSRLENSAWIEVTPNYYNNKNGDYFSDNVWV